MKKIILMSALLFSFNGWAECNISEDYDVWRECILKERAKAESKTKKQSKSKKVICNISEDYDVWRECILKERAKAESKTKKQSKSKKVDNQGSTQSRSTNNQSQQLNILERCLQSQAQSRKRYTCSPHLTKQGGFGGFVEQVNACRSETQRMFPDSVCYGAPPPRYEAPQQNNSVQLCNFKCQGGQIVQGDCNRPAVTVNGNSCWKMK